VVTFLKLCKEILHWLLMNRCNIPYFTSIDTSNRCRKDIKDKNLKFGLALNLLHQLRASIDVIGARYYIETGVESVYYINSHYN